MRGLPRQSALHRSQYGDQADWGVDAQLLAVIGDALHDANWQRGGDDGAQRPPRIPRPWVTEDAALGTVMSVEEMDLLLLEWNGR